MRRTERATARIVGLRIQDARQRAMLTHTALERMTGVPAAQVAEFESGSALPDLATLVRIAHVLELDPAVFVTGILPPVAAEQPEPESAPGRVHDLDRERVRRRGVPGDE